MKKLWNKFKTWALKIWHQLDNWQTLLLFVIVCAVVYCPVWGGFVLHSLFHWKWALWMAGAVAAFWAAPFTPFFPTCIAITLAIRDWFVHLHRHLTGKDKNEKAGVQSQAAKQSKTKKGSR